MGSMRGRGTTTADQSGHGSTGTLSNAVWSAAGKFGKAFSFNGSNSFVSVPDANSLDLTTGMTLEAWVNPSALGSSWRSVIFKERPGSTAYDLYAHNGVAPETSVVIGSEQELKNTAALPTGTWTHLAATYDGANLRLFVNGVQTASRALTGSIVTTTGLLKIGGNSSYPEWFSGLIDEVRIYNRALTAAQIQTDMATPLTH